MIVSYEDGLNLTWDVWNLYHAHFFEAKMLMNDHLGSTDIHKIL
jgi:hypothetical protein